MKRIKIIGAGQLGSRHLQALKSVETDLEIHVIDPSEQSLAVAKERYEAIGGKNHKINYSTTPEKTAETDIVIVATSANHRRQAVEAILEASDIKYMVLEKILFTRKEDYAAVGELLKSRGVKAWVNCCMRIMPGYEEIRSQLSPSRLSYRVTGSQFGLITNAIHYIDHVAHLTGCNDFRLSTAGLKPQPIESKRAGFLEFNGTMMADFANGTRCVMVCYETSNAPILVEIFQTDQRHIMRESEGKLWSSNAATNWAWNEISAPIPYQSQMTAWLVNSLLEKGDCGLSPYETSAHIHLQMLDPLLEHVRKTNPEINYYPFT